MPVHAGENIDPLAYKACWDFVHSLSIKEALADNDPLVQSLAVANKRLGKRRLKAIDAASLDPLAGRLLEIRREAEQANRVRTTGG